MIILSIIYCFFEVELLKEKMIEILQSAVFCRLTSAAEKLLIVKDQSFLVSQIVFLLLF